MNKELFSILALQKETALKSGIIGQYFDTMMHSAQVYSIAKRIANKIGNIDYGLLETMCFSHDTGRMVTGSKASKELKPAIFHGYEGAKIIHGNLSGIETDNFVDIDDLILVARCCESHMGGTGLNSETKKEKNIKSLFADTPYKLTIEEKILGYADLLTFARENNSRHMPYLPYHASFEQAYERVKAFGPIYAERLDNLMDDIFYRITWRIMSDLKLNEIDEQILPRDSEQPGKYDSKTRKCADMLRDYVFNYVRSDREDIIGIKKFDSGDCYKEGETSCTLELRPIGLCEHSYYRYYAAVADGFPQDDETREECFPLNQFEEIVRKYSLDSKQLNEVLGAKK